jgi:hypothetical protein
MHSLINILTAPATLFSRGRKSIALLTATTEYPAKAADFYSELASFRSISGEPALVIRDITGFDPIGSGAREKSSKIPIKVFVGPMSSSNSPWLLLELS